MMSPSGFRSIFGTTDSGARVVIGAHVLFLEIRRMSCRIGRVDDGSSVIPLQRFRTAGRQHRSAAPTGAVSPGFRGLVGLPHARNDPCLLYTSPSPRDRTRS